MVGTGNALAHLAALITYPDDGYLERLRDCGVTLSRENPAASGTLQPFVEYSTKLDAPGLEEFYTRTFDINPVCCLEVGWQLYGEEYERGSFMVKMRKALRETGLRESTELPDHLCHVLPLLDRLDPVDAAGLANACVLPALDKMIAGFAGKDNPFECVLKTIRSVTQDRYSAISGGNPNG